MSAKKDAKKHDVRDIVMHGYKTTIAQAIKQWFKEGTLAAVRLEHMQSGRGARIHEMYERAGPWAQPLKMAAAFNAIAGRHARDMIGTQHFQLTGQFEDLFEPTRFLSFVRRGGQIVVGSVVCMKSYGVYMTVLELHGDKAMCAWREQRSWGESIASDLFPIEALRLA